MPRRVGNLRVSFFLTTTALLSRLTHVQRVIPLQRSVIDATVPRRVSAIRIIVSILLRGLVVSVWWRIGILPRVVRVKVVTLLTVLQALVPRHSSRRAARSRRAVVVPVGRVEWTLSPMRVVRVRLLAIWVVPAGIRVRRAVLRVLRHGLVDR